MIEQLLAPHHVRFNEAYERLTDSPIKLIKEINRHVQGNNGKQLRPQMTILTALSCGLASDIPADHPIYDISAAIETLHASTLIHDDIIDDSDTRRGQPSVKHLWGNKVAVLAGDYYLAKVMQTLNRVDNKEITRIVDNAVTRMCEGELLQQQHNGIYSQESEIYMAIIERKTASFMSACCQVGATLATDEPELREKARQFGLNAGIAFQIRDDILDYMPTEVTGKPQGNDLREGRCTLPLIYALRDSDKDRRDKIVTILKEKELNDTNLQYIIGTVREFGGLERAAQSQEQYLDKARNALHDLPDNQYREALEDMIEW